MSGLEAIDSSLPSDGVVAPGNGESFGKSLLQCIDHIVQSTEQNKLFARGEEVADEIHGIADFADSGKASEVAELHKSFHSHLSTYLPFGAVGVLPQIFGKVGLSEEIFIAVVNIHNQLNASFVGKLRQHFSLFATYEASAVELL